MATITYNLTADQLAEMLLALNYHRGDNLDTATEADLKAFGLMHFQEMVQIYRESVINAANPVDKTAVAS